MKIPKIVLAAIIVFMSIAAVLVAKAIFLHPSSDAVIHPAEKTKTRVKGDPSASVKVIEFTDFQCPACAKAAVMVEDVLKKYPGRIYFEMKYFPLAMHAHARRASVYAECAAQQGKFWPFHDVLFGSQTSWARMGSVDAYFSQLAVSMGLNGVGLSTCVNSGEVNVITQRDVEEGNKLHVNSTPTFFINGKMVVGGKEFSKEIEEIFKSNAK